MRTGPYIVVAHAERIEARTLAIGRGFLHLVTPEELRELQQHLQKGLLPADLERKLCMLEHHGMMQQFIAQNCRLFVLLLTAVYSGMFQQISRQDCDEILRVLAYVRKDDDAIPDYSTGGFVDDSQEVRGVIAQKQNLLDRFKAWRLSHQVPGMWRN